MHDAEALPDRLRRRVQLTENGCWAWTGQIDRYGYGRLGGRLAHRLIYSVLVGEIPNGLVIDHLCRNRSCVNPADLELVTSPENTRRGQGRRGLSKTHCSHGHAFTEDNIHWTRSGDRECLTCRRATWRAASARYSQRKRERSSTR